MPSQVIEVIDSHTEGEPTRIIHRGGPELGDGPLPQRVIRFRQEFDDVRRGVINEPRGNDVLVGGLLCQPHDESCSFAVIFFNNHGYLGMCGHGMIGFLVTLKHLGLVDSGEHRIETPVGVVTATLHGDHQVTIENVPSFRYLKDVEIEVEPLGRIVGDVAWGGNWFFLVKNLQEDLDIGNVDRLTWLTKSIRDQLTRQQITGIDNAWIDHIEIFAEAGSSDCDSKNFVLCPGSAYDRSPCGTGTSAKLACLAADGKLQPGQIWRQESIIGSSFRGQYRQPSDQELQSMPQFSRSLTPEQPVIVPSITGSAYICGETKLIFNAADPFRQGIPT